MKIVKRDKTIEDFDISKINRVIQAAGLSKEDADRVTDNVQKWVNDNFAINIISDMVREKVFDELCQINKRVADMFQWYEDNKYKK